VSRQPARETDQLTHVIRVIQRARRSGMLEVQRRIGASLVEAGTIVFVKGSIVDAHVGHTQGKEASNVLSQWTHCSFTFVSSNPYDQPLEFPSSSAPAQMSSMLNSQQLIAGSAEMSPSQKPVASQTNDALLQQGSGSLPAISLSSMPTHLQTVEASTKQIEQLNYPRSYRQLCLLIDGHHSIADLSRLLGRRPTEVVKMLNDLERAKCIRLSHQ
jgi:hypothetical protein